MNQIDYNINGIKDFVEKNGNKFSCGWELSMPDIKDENHKVVPIIDGQLKLAYFEQLCYIYDKNNKEVGMWFVVTWSL